MADSRRRSPESSRRRKRERRASRERLANDNNNTTSTPDAYYNSNNNTNNTRSQPQMDSSSMRHRRRAASSSSSSSSTSSSLLDISRKYPTTDRRYGNAFTTFFKAPSERRRLRRKRSGKKSKKQRVLYFGNSSSSSLNSDLAYGTGYIPRRKSRDFSRRHESYSSAPVAGAAAVGAAAATYAATNRPSSAGYPSQGHPQSYSHPPPQQSTSYAPGVGATAATAAAAGAAAGLAAEYYNAGRDIPSKPATPRRRKTDDEIMAIGRQLSDLAKAQNDEDLRNAGKSRPSGLVSAATKYNDYRNSKYGASRGIGGSKPMFDSSDDSDWESASDDDSDDSADTSMAYGTVVSQAIRPTAAAMAGAAAGAAIASGSRDDRKSSVVDPRLFGPVNSLRGMINTPCGFGDDQAGPSSRNGDPRPLTRSATEPLGQMRNVYPVSTSDPNRFDTDLPRRARPGPVPLQQPIPQKTVSPKLYDAEKLEDISRRESKQARRQSESDKNWGWGETAAAGVAAAAVGAAIAKDRKEDRKDKDDRRKSREYRDDEKRDREKDKRSDREKRDKDTDREREKEKEKRREKESRDKDKEREREKDKDRKSKRDSYSSKYPDDKSEKSERESKSKRDSYSCKYADEKDRDRDSKSQRDPYSSKYSDDKDKDRKRSSRYDVREDFSKSRQDLPLDMDPYQALNKRSGESSRQNYEPEDQRTDLSRSSRRDSKKYDGRTDPRDIPLPEKAGLIENTGTDQAPKTTAVDPFQYQVDSFQKNASSAGPARPLTPSVVTVDREPDFDDSPPYSPRDGRLSRKDSFELEQYIKGNTPDAYSYGSGKDYVSAKSDKSSKSAIVGAGVAAAAAGVLAEQVRSKDRRRDEYSDEGSQERTRPRDAVQEEADRYYREQEVARKIASEQIRSRSRTPDKSVVDKWQDDVRRDGDRKRDRDQPLILDGADSTGNAMAVVKSPYAEPDADVRIDNTFSPKEAHAFRRTSISSKSRDLKSRDPSAERDRPILNLVYPTPVSSRQPTPAVEKQDERERSAKDRGSKDSKTSKDSKDRKSKDRDSKESKSSKDRDSMDRDFKDREVTSRSEVGSSKKRSKDKDDRTSKSEVGSSSSRRKSTKDREDDASKSVTWGENETKSFEVITPEPRDDRQLGESTDKERPRLSSSSQWGILAAAISGSGTEPANEPDFVTESPKEIEPSKQQARDFGSRTTDQASRGPTGDSPPPVFGPKPASPNREQMPGGYADDIEFAATLAAGLKDTGFDPNIVIDDPVYRRRDSPPGTNELNGSGSHQAPETGYVIGEVETPKDEAKPAEPEDEWADAPVKLSKKERKKLEKQKKQQEDEAAREPAVPVEAPTPPPAVQEPEEPPVKLSKKEQRKRDKEAKARALAAEDDQLFAEPEPIEPAGNDTWEEASTTSKKSKGKSRDLDEGGDSKVSVPIDTFADLTSSKEIDPADEWNEPKKSKKKSKRDSKNFDAEPSGSWDDMVAAEEITSKEVKPNDEWDEPKKSKKKSKRDSKSYDSATETPLDDMTSSREINPNDEWDEPKKSKKSKRDSGVYGSPTPSALRSEVSLTSSDKKSKRDSGVYDSPTRSAHQSEVSLASSEKKSKKSKRRSGTEDDFDGYGSDPPDRKRDFFEDRDVSSVVSDSRYDEKRSKRSYRYDDDDDAKSVASAPGGSRKSKSSSDKRSSGGSLFSSIFKSKDDNRSRESFLGNAGTLGAGAGLAGVAAASASSRLNAADSLSEKKDSSEDDIHEWARDDDPFDSDIVARAIKPAIDPQYGDLLPLPPSEPGSPVGAPEELPSLPDSRPDTPPEERNLKPERFTHARRRSAQETPTKSPSTTAIPLNLRLGGRGGPSSSPSAVKSSPAGSPSIGGPDSPGSARRPSRPASWDNSREIKPLYLLEHARHSSIEDVDQANLPELPPSETSSHGSSPSPASAAEDWESADEYAHGGDHDNDFAGSGLHIDTSSVPTFGQAHDRAGSQETTPRAEIKPEFPDVARDQPSEPSELQEETQPDPVEPMSKDRSSYLLQSGPSSTKSNRTVDSDTAKQNLLDMAATPSKTPWSGRGLDEIDEGSISTDDHFSDAVEGPSEEPAASRDLSAPGEEEPPAEDFSMLTGKAKKKAKKAAKKKQAFDLENPVEASESSAAEAATEVADDWAEKAGEDDVSRDVAESAEPSKPSEGSEPVPAPASDEPEAWETTGKKGKKKKKKGKASMSWEDEPAPADKSISEPEAAPAEEAAEPETKDAAPLEPEAAAFEDPEATPRPAAEEFAPAPLSKKEKKKLKKKGLMAADDSWIGEKEEEVPAAEVDTAVEDTAPTEPEPSATQDVEAAPADATEPSVDDFAPAPLSKKEKKKLKKKGLMAADDSWIGEKEEEAPISGAEPVEDTTMAEPEPSVIEDVEAAPVEATEPTVDDFAPAPLSKKEKKKLKKKGLMAADDSWIGEKEEDVPAAETPAPETESTQLDEAPGADSKAIESEAAPTDQPPIEEAAAQPEEEFAPVTKKKKKKDKKKSLQLDTWDEPSSTPTGDEKSEDITGSKYLNISEEPVTVSTATADDNEASAWEQTISDKGRSLEPEISEPLFSQGDASAKTTQATDSFLSETDEQKRDEPAEEAWGEVSTSKKGKKNKKKQQTFSWDALDEDEPKESVQDSWDAPEEPTTDDVGKDATAHADDAPDDWDAPREEPSEAPAADEWDRPMSKKEKKKAAKKRQQELEEEEPQEETDLKAQQASDGWDLDDDFFNKPVPKEEPSDDLGWDKPAEEPKEDAQVEDEWSIPITGKKAKKAKKKQARLSMEQALELVGGPSTGSSADAEPESTQDVSFEDQQDKAAPADEWPEATSKKAKKKKKQQAALEALAAEEEASAKEAIQEPESKDELGTGIDDRSPENTSGFVTPAESVSGQDVDANPDDEWGGFSLKTTKKDKNKKAKDTESEQAQEPETTPHLESESEPRELDDSAGQTTEPTLSGTGFEDPSLVDEPASIDGTPTEASPPADQEWGFGLSKKEKKKKKRKSVTFDLGDSAAPSEQNDEDSASRDLSAADLSTGSQPANDNEVIDKLEDNAESSNEAATPAEKVPEDDGDDFWGVPLSKKDKKRRKKALEAAALAAQENADEVLRDAESFSAPESSPTQDKPSLPEETKDLEQEVEADITEDPLVTEPSTVEEPQEDDESWAFGLSKKDKKKKKKAMAAAALAAEAELDPTTEQAEEAGLAKDVNDPPAAEETEEPASEPEPSSVVDDTSVVQEQEPAADVSELVDDDWTIGLSKKEIKKRKKAMAAAALAAQEEPTNVKPEDDTRSIPDATDETPAAAEQEPEQEPAEASEPDAEDWTIGLSKKEIKKKKKAMAAAELAAEATSANHEHEPESLAEEVAPTALEEASTAEDVKDIASTGEAAVEDETPSQPTDMPSAPEPQDDDWMIGLSKKELKKQKKARAAAALAVDETPVETESEDKDPEGSHDMDDTSLEAEGAKDESATAPEDQLAEAPEPQDDDWTIGLSKKEIKKQKKARAAAALAADDAPVDSEPSSTGAEALEAIDEAPTELEASKEVDEAAALGNTPDTTEAEAPTEPEPQDDDWTIGLSKKEIKKKKKAMAAAALAAEEAPVELESQDVVQPEPESEPIQSDVLQSQEDTSPPVEDSKDLDSQTAAKEDVASTEVAEPSEQQEADNDDWTIGLSKKEIKKRRKAMAAAALFTEDEPAESDSAAPPEPVVSTEPTMEPEEASKSMDDHPTEAEAPREEEPPAAVEEPTPFEDDDWTIGLSKKEIKKKKKAMAAAAATEASLEPEPEAEVQTEPEPEGPMSLDDATAPEPAEEEVPGVADTQDDDWTIGLSKKEIKKRKKTMAAAALAATEMETEPAEPLETTEATELAETAEPTVPEVQDDAPTESSREAELEAAPEDQEPPVEDDDWTIGLSKKEIKKKKKAMAASALAASEPEIEPSEPNDPNETADPADPILSEIQDDTLAASGTEEAAPAEEPPVAEDDDWTAGLSKKEIKKKKKAMAAAALAAPEPEIEPSEPPESSFRDAQDNETSESSKDAPHEAPVEEAAPAVEDDDWTVGLSKKEIKKKKKAMAAAALAAPENEAESFEPEVSKSLEDAPALEETAEPIPDKPATEVVEPQEEDWTIGLSKKEIKKKKKAMAAAALAAPDDGLDVSNTQEDVSPEETEVLSVEVPAIEAEEEDWTIGLSKKEIKKKKKAMAAAALAAPDEDFDAPQASEDVKEPEAEPQEPTPQADSMLADVPSEPPVEASEEPETWDHQNTHVEPEATREEKPDNESSKALESTEDAATAEQTPTIQDNDDDWGFGLSKKDKKKKKKAKALEMDWGTTANTAANESESVSVDKDMEQDTAEVSEVVQPREESSVDVPAVEEAPTTEEAQASAPQDNDDDWGFGLSKKDKKKKKKQAKALGMDWEPTPEPAAELDQVETATETAQPETITEEPTEPAAQPAAEVTEPMEDEWSFGTSKKDKKMKKKSQALDLGDWGEPEPAETSTLRAPEEPEVAAPREPTTWADEAAAEDPSRDYEPQDQPEPEKTDDEGFSMAGLSKKDKKKLKKKAKALGQPDPFEEAALAETADTETTAPEGADDVSAGQAEAETSRALDTWDEAEAPKESKDSAEDDEWSLPTKKSKKVKKLNASRLAMFEQPGEEEEEASSAEKTASEDVTKPVGEEQPQEELSSSLDKPETAMELETSQLAPEPSAEATEVKPEQDWEVPVKKKSKKGKKRDSLPDTPVETSRAASPARDSGDLDSFANQPEESQSKDITMGDIPPGAERTRGEDASHREPRSDVWGQVAAAATVAAGAAMAADTPTPGKKGKKGKKNKKSIDKRQPQEADIFDDPALWESADKKNVEEQADDGNAVDDFWGEGDGEKTKAEIAAKENDDFWGGGDEEEADVEKSKELLSTEEAQRGLPTPKSESPSESEGGWKETSRQGAPLDDEHDESPIMGRSEFSTSRSGPVGLLRRGSDMDEPVGGLLQEDTHASALSGGQWSDFGGSRLSPARSLPAVQEDPEEEAETSRGLPHTPDMNRDSGFVADSPKSQHRRGHLFAAEDEEPQRDSGVHTDDWDTPPARVAPKTPSSKKSLGRSSFGTPVLREPSTPELTPEPEKKSSSKPRKSAAAETHEAREAPSSHKTSRSREWDDGFDGSHRPSPKSSGRDLGEAPSLKPSRSKGYGELAPAAPVTSAGSARGSSGQQRSVSDSSVVRGATAGGATGASGSGPQREGPSPGQPALGAPQPHGLHGLHGAPHSLRRSVSNTSNTSLARKHTPEPLKFRPDSPGSGIGRNTNTPTPPLRRVDKRVSGDLRALRQQTSETSTSTTPVANEGRLRSAKDAAPSKESSKDSSRDMADVFDGFGEGRIGSPRSPTRPHSMRRRQSMQVLELESRVEQLIAENRLLSEARSHAESNISGRAANVLSERDSEIEGLKQSLQLLQSEVTRLTEVNEGLTSANAELANKDTSGRYADLEVHHAGVSRGLDEAGGSHNNYEQSLQDKDAEIAELRSQLEDAKEQVRDMQRQILASKSGDADFLNVQDEDYFDNRCQQLCSHVQQWVLRFSKFSDMRACRLTSEISDEKTIDRLDNAVLDGSDVDRYLADRVKRRDIFMSMTMNMIWEFVFTRYLFGMDREQRQKLKSLEKMLTEVGPPQAVRQWRAVTLTLLAKRDNFVSQKEQDTEAVVQAIFQTLCKILPPPGNLENQIQTQLRRVLREAVDLSVEMRTQKAEYMMLPPLQPEYDAEGELAATVQFNSSMMNERSGKNATTNEDLEAEGAVVRVVLFPLVVKKGDDAGVGDEEIVVCPAQVIVASDKGRRSIAPSSDAGGASLGGRSHLSVVTEHMTGT